MTLRVNESLLCESYCRSTGRYHTDDEVHKRSMLFLSVGCSSVWNFRPQITTNQVLVTRSFTKRTRRWTLGTRLSIQKFEELRHQYGMLFSSQSLLSLLAGWAWGTKNKWCWAWCNSGVTFWLVRPIKSSVLKCVHYREFETNGFFPTLI